MTNIITLIRGLSGSGKTTAAMPISGIRVSTDDFFMLDGEYVFNPKLLGKNHQRCQTKVEELMVSNKPHIVVDNTFSQRWEMEAYLTLATIYGYTVSIIDIFDGGCSDKELFERNTHNVPLETIIAMRHRYEHDWESGSPAPPWER